MANETVSSNGDNTSVNTLATNTNGIDKETIEQNIHSTPLQTTEGRSSSSVQKSEINSQSINISDIKQVTENAVSSNNISGFEKVASSPMTIDSTPKTNTLDKDVTKQSKDIKFTESLPMESTDIEHFINTKTTAIPASSPTFNGKSTEKPTDIIDIKPIDKLPNEKKVSNITDSTSATVNTDSTKPKQTPPTKIRPTVLNKTTPTTSVHHSDVGAISSSQPVFNERAANDKAFVWKRTALSNGKDTLANMDDENVKSTTAHLLDLLVNNTSDFIFTFMTANPALLNNASSSKPGPKVKTTIIDNNVDTDVSSTSDTYRKTTLSETNENTEHTSQSVTSDSKSETPVPKPGVTTLNISLPKTGATTPKTDKVSTEKNDRTTVLKPFTPTTDKAKETIDTAENLVKPGKSNVLNQ